MSYLFIKTINFNLKNKIILLLVALRLPLTIHNLPRNVRLLHLLLNHVQQPFLLPPHTLPLAHIIPLHPNLISNLRQKQLRLFPRKLIITSLGHSHQRLYDLFVGCILVEDLIVGLEEGEVGFY